MMLTLFDWRICGRHRLPSVGRQSETGSSGGEGGIRSQEGLDRSVSYRRSVAAFGYFARLCRRALPKIAQTSGVVEFVGNMHGSVPETSKGAGRGVRLRHPMAFLAALNDG
jgi:hypothetical protein